LVTSDSPRRIHAPKAGDFEAAAGNTLWEFLRGPDINYKSLTNTAITGVFLRTVRGESRGLAINAPGGALF
jgi:hypothetical protein